MLDELRPILHTTKANDILGRLADSRPEQALGAEMELGLLWAIKQVADVEIEPALPHSSSRPEALSTGLFGQISYIEITTLSDGKLSGEEDMRRATHKIVAYANSIKKRGGANLYFTFNDTSSWENNVYTRKHCVTPSFELDQCLKDQISAWLKNYSGSEGVPLRLQNDHIDVLIEVKNHPQRQGFNFFSRLPPLAHDIEDNPLFSRLKEKADQLSSVPEDALKIIFVSDGGSRLLRLIQHRDHLRRYKSGAQIIQHFLDRSSVHAVCVFAPHRQKYFFDRSASLSWQVSLFCRNGIILPDDKLKKLAQALPAPRVEGYQARSLHKQGVFEPDAPGWYLGTEISFGGISQTMKMSARLLHEYLAGKISSEQFERNAFGEGNDFRQLLERGYALRNAKFESAGVDEDDDYIIFEFSADPAASLLK
jgi:hypothetical protein